MEENYKEIRGYSLKYFWSDVLEDKELSILMDEKKHVRRRLRLLPKPVTGEGGSASDDADPPITDEDVDCRLKITPEDEELFCIGRSFGTQDFVGQRVLQVLESTNLELTPEPLTGDNNSYPHLLTKCQICWGRAASLTLYLTSPTFPLQLSLMCTLVVPQDIRLLFAASEIKDRHLKVPISIEIKLTEYLDYGAGAVCKKHPFR